MPSFDVEKLIILAIIDRGEFVKTRSRRSRMQSNSIAGRFDSSEESANHRRDGVGSNNILYHFINKI